MHQMPEDCKDLSSQISIPACKVTAGDENGAAELCSAAQPGAPLHGFFERNGHSEALRISFSYFEVGVVVPVLDCLAMIRSLILS
jgi:hypothetical protein